MCDSARSSAWLYRGLTASHDAASDASSQDAYAPAYLLQAPSKLVVAQLSTSSHGEQLLQIVRTLGSQLLAQSLLCPSAAAARGLQDGMQEMHSCIVALDDMIDEQRISSGVATQLDECRQWLRHTQGFVLQLLKQVHGFATEDSHHPPAAAASTSGSMDAATAVSSMEEGSCSTSTAPNSAASLHAWRTMCTEASDALGTVAESMSNGGGEASGSTGKRTRLVAQSSRLSYATHWSKKVAI